MKIRKRELLTRIHELQIQVNRLRTMLDNRTVDSIRKCNDCGAERSVDNLYENENGTWHCNHGGHLNEVPFVTPNQVELERWAVSEDWFWDGEEL